MSTTGNGWTKETPTANGLYFWRADERDIEPELHEVADGKVYRIESRRSEPIENYGGQWLGPFTAHDIEQLAALRKELAERDRLIVHMHVHSGYPNNGYMQMTTPQKELYDAIWNQSVAELDAERPELELIAKLEHLVDTHGSKS